MKRKPFIIIITIILILSGLGTSIIIYKNKNKNNQPSYNDSIKEDTNDIEKEPEKEAEQNEEPVIDEPQKEENKETNKKPTTSSNNNNSKPTTSNNSSTNQTNNETVKEQTSNNSTNNKPNNKVDTSSNSTTNNNTNNSVNNSTTNTNNTSNTNTNKNENTKPSASDSKEESKNETNTNTPSTNNNSNTTSNTTSNTNNNLETNPPKKPSVEEPIDEIDELRKKLENTYNITIKYGEEIGDYKPKGLTPTKLLDKEKIKNALNKMDYELKKYPTGFFKEMKEFDMPITFYLINNIPNNAFDGYTDREFMNNIKITLVYSELMAYTLNHEIMHYIDSYLEIKTYPTIHYDEYSSLNPSDFNYGSINNNYTFAYGKNYNEIYFISDYSQTNVREDRAEIFKYIMTRSYMQNGMFEKDEVTSKKVLIIDKQIRENFKCAKGTLYWEKNIKK